MPPPGKAILKLSGIHHGIGAERTAGGIGAVSISARASTANGSIMA
jgi:hypothetical protein